MMIAMGVMTVAHPGRSASSGAVRALESGVRSTAVTTPMRIGAATTGTETRATTGGGTIAGGKLSWSPTPGPSISPTSSASRAAKSSRHLVGAAVTTPLRLTVDPRAPSQWRPLSLLQGVVARLPAHHVRRPGSRRRNPASSATHPGSRQPSLVLVCRCARRRSQTIPGCCHRPLPPWPRQVRPRHCAKLL